jgi:cytochrome c biogenesis protein CcmG, thiol:disulfide interchange protein DsbE
MTLAVSAVKDTAVCHPFGVMPRRLLWVLAGAALAAVVVVGVLQALGDNGSGQPAQRRLTSGEIQAKLAGAPPRLAALHRQANEILPGQREALHARLRALRGHPVVVNIWAAWCGPCREELPILQRASVDWGKRVAFVGVDLKDERASAERLLAKFPLAYPSYDDPHAKIFNSYKILGTPSTVYYDGAGRQTYIHQGPYLDRAQFDADLRRYALS